MKISEVLALVRELQPSQYEDKVFVRWLSELDGKIYRDIIAGHKDAPEEAPGVYDPDDDLETELLVPFPDDGLYAIYLCAKIDWQNKDFDRYNNGTIAFSVALNEFAAAYNRAHISTSTVTFKGILAEPSSADIFTGL